MPLLRRPMSKARAKPKTGGAATRKRTGHPAQTAAAGLLDALQKFEDFSTKILPALQKDLLSGMGAKELREKYAAIIQARQITTAILSQDEGRASVAAKDVLDRTEGKATERKEVTHKFADLPDEELDAIIRSEEEELAYLEKSVAEH